MSTESFCSFWEQETFSCVDCLKEGSSWFYCEFCAKCREYSYIKVVYPEKQLQKYWFNTVVRVVCVCVCSVFFSRGLVFTPGDEEDFCARSYFSLSIYLRFGGRKPRAFLFRVAFLWSSFVFVFLFFSILFFFPIVFYARPR